MQVCCPGGVAAASPGQQSSACECGMGGRKNSAAKRKKQEQSKLVKSVLRTCQ